MAKEIPLPLIKANQAGIVLFVVLGIALGLPALIYVIFLIQLISLLAGQAYNPFVAIAKVLFNSKLGNSETQAAELAKFNQTIAVALLGVASAAWLVGWSVVGYAAAAMVAVAATAALAGYCIGCTIYFQFKKWKALRGRTSG